MIPPSKVLTFNRSKNVYFYLWTQTLCIHSDFMEADFIHGIIYFIVFSHSVCVLMRIT